jgi:hypothetical protein
MEHVLMRVSTFLPVALRLNPAPDTSVPVVCESCRLAPAVRRVLFADGAVFDTCAPCSRGALRVETGRPTPGIAGAALVLDARRMRRAQRQALRVTAASVTAAGRVGGEAA